MIGLRLVPGALLLVVAGGACTSTIVLPESTTGGTGGAGGSVVTTATATTGSSTTTATSGGGGAGGPATTTTTTGAGGATSSSTSTGSTGSSGGTGACAPTSACGAADDACIGLVNNSGKTTFGLRMSELDFSAPFALAQGIVESVLAGAVTPDAPACNLDGSGTFSWLLQFDTTAGTLETGGARPVADPGQGYAFDDETITQGATAFHVQPVTYPVTLSPTNSFSVVTGQDLVMPVFLNAAGTETILLPLRAARLTLSTLSASHDCIGGYNGATLDPADSCQSDPTQKQFTEGGSLDAFIVLDDADTVIISSLDESLCLLLAGNSAMYGTMDPDGIAVCARNEAGVIVYQGNWCSTTNAAATSTCSDSVSVGANYAASSVLITN